MRNVCLNSQENNKDEEKRKIPKSENTIKVST
jgi:hypothetical protein